MSRTGSQPGSPMGSASKTGSQTGSQPGTPHDLQGHPVAFDSGSAGQGSLMGSRSGSQDMGSVQVGLQPRWLLLLASTVVTLLEVK